MYLDIVPASGIIALCSIASRFVMAGRPDPGADPGAVTVRIVDRTIGSAGRASAPGIVDIVPTRGQDGP